MREHVKRKVSYRELVLYTYVVCGVAENDPDFKELFDEMLKDPLEATYCVALQAMVLEEVDRVKYQYRILQCAKFLVDNQSPQGTWGYGTPTSFVADFAGPKGKGGPPVAPPPAPGKEQPGFRARPAVTVRLKVTKDKDGEPGDNSNTYFAALGLRACHDSGIQLPPKVVDLAMKWIRDSQKREKVAAEDFFDSSKKVQPLGWCYRDHAEHKAYGSMTAAMVASLMIWDYIKDNDEGKKKTWKKDPDIHEGLQWLSKNYSVAYNPGPYEHAKFEENSKHNYGYYLHALSGAALMYGTEALGTPKWYGEGVKALTAVPSVDGRFGDGTGDTCLTLLFLTRGTRWLSPP